MQNVFRAVSVFSPHYPTGGDGFTREDGLRLRKAARADHSMDMDGL